MNFSWKKNSLKERIFFNKNNDDLLEELKEKGIIDNNILSAIKKVPRELFINKISIQHAYENRPLPIDCEQTISQPYVCLLYTSPSPRDKRQSRMPSSA